MLKVQEDLEEVLEIQTHLMEIIIEREIFESENKNIDEQVDYSTVYLKIQQTNQAHIEPAKVLVNVLRQHSKIHSSALL